MASSIMPNRPFIGVRSSWLMLARNSDLALLASIASACAFLDAARASFNDARADVTCSSIGLKINMASHSSSNKVKTHRNISIFSTRLTLLVAANSKACTTLSSPFSSASLFCALKLLGGGMQVASRLKNLFASRTYCWLAESIACSPK